MLNERLLRVTDLFIEGTELYFGMDEVQQPIVMWVNKLNSFEIEEARRDAMVKRGMRIAELSKPENPEFAAVMATINGWTDDKLAEERVEQKGDELYLDVLNDIEAEEGWKEKLDTIRRGPTLLDDEGAPDDDPRRADLLAVQQEYIAKVREGQERAQQEALREVKDQGRAAIIEEYLEHWRNRVSLDVFMSERRVSELYAALRDCKAKVRFELPRDGSTQKLEFDHTDCNHSVRLLSARSDVYSLPEAIIERAGDALDGITATPRDAGNSDAPASSSASSEQSSAEVEASTPSTPVETPLDAPMT